MQDFSEEHSALLLTKEWLVKVDNNTSTPYLIKFHANLDETNPTCVFLVTDTKLWIALKHTLPLASKTVLSGKDIARRWRNQNANSSPDVGTSEESSWRLACLELLSKAHTLGNIMEVSFDVADSIYSDKAFELECEAFKWRWETNFVGYKQSAEIISKHLVMPLISVNHLAFSSADPVCELPEADLEKAVDKMGRTARRTLDTHVRHAMSKPRIATTLRRITAMFNFASDLPSITSNAEKPILTPVPIPQSNPPQSVGKGSTLLDVNISDRPYETHHAPSSKQGPSTAKNDSETESDNDVPETSSQRFSAPLSSQMQIEPRSPNPGPSKPPNKPPLPTSDNDSSPPRKKPKPPVSSSEDEDSEAERRRRIARLKQGAGSTSTRPGARQPIKRGGKRF